MGSSHGETKQWIMESVTVGGVTSILAVGAGAGIYAHAMAAMDWWGRIEALEVWEPYVEQFALEDIYAKVHRADVRGWDDFAYDLVIFGDVLGHMTKTEAKEVWAKAQLQAKFGVIAIPIVRFEQGALNDNPHEVHVTDDWTRDSVIESFSSITTCWTGRKTRAFWAPSSATAQCSGHSPQRVDSHHLDLASTRRIPARASSTAGLPRPSLARSWAGICPAATSGKPEIGRTPCTCQAAWAPSTGTLAKPRCSR